MKEMYSVWHSHYLVDNPGLVSNVVHEKERAYEFLKKEFSNHLQIGCVPIIGDNLRSQKRFDDVHRILARWTSCNHDYIKNVG